MSLTMIQLTPDMSRLVRFAHAHGLLPARGEDDLGYALHAALAAAFGARAPKPFALRRGKRGEVAILGYTDASEQALRDEAAAFAEPEAAEAVGLKTLACKEMPVAWAAGQRLGFEVRTRPMIRTDRDGDRGKARERDVFLAAVDGLGPGEGPSRGEVYATWLAGKLSAGGTAVEHVVLDAFRLTRTLRRNRERRLVLVPDPARAKVMGGAAGSPDATFTGVLRVADGEAFAALLARGVGRHRAFGFGMLLLRPA